MTDLKFRLITTPLYYVNAKPHIGHAYTTIAADILARYYRLKGEKVFFLTGTDEHGQKVEEAAKKNGMSPKDHADRMVDNFRGLWKKLNISEDHKFIRTTDPGHEKIVKEILQKLYDDKKIVPRKYSGWYCVPEERFWTDKDLVDGNCPDCGRPVEHIEEENYFFLMSEYQNKLIEHIEKYPDYIQPDTRRNEVLGFLNNNKLEDLCISRPKSRLSWGIEIPFDKDYVTYVWFDALINYYSATTYLSPDNNIPWWPAKLHLIGKDILTTHSVYWSTMLMALGYDLPETIFAHGWWMMEDEKMSKSLGNVVDPLELVNEFGADAFRFYLFRKSVFGKDASFSYEGFGKTYETELANELGNLLSRVLSMIQKYDCNFIETPNEIIKVSFETLLDDRGIIEEGYNSLNFYGILNAIWDRIRQANAYIESEKPWALAKENMNRLQEVLSVLFYGLKIISGAIYPFMPATSKKNERTAGVNTFKRS
ncbi:MAG: methionine--tRNA ligase [Elusimicrobiota bacterium]